MGDTVTRFADTPGQIITGTFEATPITSTPPTVAYYSDASYVTLVSGPTAMTELSASVWTGPVPNLGAQTLYIDYAYRTQVGGVLLHNRNDVLRLAVADVFSGNGSPAPFATPAQLASSLGVEVPTDPLILGRWQDALNDASGYLRALIGQPIASGTANLRLTTDDRGEADIWLVPVTAITSVTDPEGNVLTSDDWRLVDQRLYLRRGCTTYVVVISYGYTPIPTEIVRWTKVLAATQIRVAASGSLGLSNVASLAIDDAKISYRDAMAVVMPDGAAQWLKATFGGPQ